MSAEAFWYLIRATGVVSLVLMTATVVLGVVVQRQRRLPGLPRFGAVALHRNVSLISALLLLVHVVTSVADSYVGIPALAALVPFTSTWRPAGIGLGALAVELGLVIVVSSLLRGRLPRRVWQPIHRSAYLLWPLAFVHGLMPGTDLGSGWALALALACAAVVAGTTVVAWTGRHTVPADRAPAALARASAALAGGPAVPVLRNR
ncbi:ferric reductase-like transmembrane domain-containing protein [Geodermatophilus sp. URMC 64]